MLLVAAALPSAPAGVASSGNIDAIPPVVTYTLDAKQDRKGVLITNSPYGYYTGRLFVNDKVTELFATKTRVYTYDMITENRGSRHIERCGWIESVVLRKGTHEAVPSSPCREPRSEISRPSFGREFNCAANVCIDGAPTHVTARCDDRAYYNRAPQLESSADARTIQGFYDYAGPINRQLPVYYRYTSLDRQAAIIRTRAYGWVYVDRSCIAGYPRGGTPKPLPLALAPPMIMGKARSLTGVAVVATRQSAAAVNELAASVTELTAGL
jgi:hypothetical protein